MGKHDGSQIRKSIEDVKASSKVLYFWRGGNWGSNNIISNRQNKLLPDSLMSRRLPHSGSHLVLQPLHRLADLAWRGSSTAPANACPRSSPCDRRWERGPWRTQCQSLRNPSSPGRYDTVSSASSYVSSTCQAQSDQLAVIADGLVLFLQHAEVCNIPPLWF